MENIGELIGTINLKVFDLSLEDTSVSNDQVKELQRSLKIS